MNFSEWQATKTRVSDIGAMLGLPAFTERSGLVYAGNLVIEERSESARAEFAMELVYIAVIGRHEFMAPESNLADLEHKVFSYAVSQGIEMTPVPLVFDAPPAQTATQAGMRTCPACLSEIPAAARRCRYCTAISRPVVAMNASTAT